MIEEYCEEGDLEYYLKRQLKFKKKIQEEIVSRWMLQILLALEYLHYNKVIHRYVTQDAEIFGQRIFSSPQTETLSWDHLEPANSSRLRLTMPTPSSTRPIT